MRILMRGIGFIFGVLLIFLMIFLNKPRQTNGYHSLTLYDYHGIYDYSIFGRQLNQTQMRPTGQIHANFAEDWLVTKAKLPQTSNDCRVVRLRPDGSALNEISTISCDTRLGMSSHGNWLFYQDDNQPTLVRPDGSERHLLEDYPAKNYTNFVDWSPDGNWFIYEVAPHEDLIAVNTSTFTQYQLTASPEFDGTVQWSPDSEWIIYANANEDNVDLYRTRYDGSEQLNLTQHLAEDGFIGWSPDNEWILFWSKRNGTQDIYRVRLDGTAMQLLSDRKAFTDYFGWSADQQWFYIKSGWDIWRVAFDGSQSEQISEDIIINNTPRWSNDNEWIYFIGADETESHFTRSQNIYRIRADGSDVQILSDFEGNYIHLMEWSPDKKWLVVANGQEIMIISNDGQTQIPLHYPLRPITLQWHIIRTTPNFILHGFVSAMSLLLTIFYLLDFWQIPTSKLRLFFGRFRFHIQNYLRQAPN